MNTKIPRSLLCPDCNVPMRFSHTYEAQITPPSGQHSGGTATTYSGQVDEFGYGSRTLFVYICPICSFESDSELKFEE